MRSLFLILSTLVSLCTSAWASPLVSGEYECRIDTGYRFRPCTITVQDSGRIELAFGGGLVGVRGRLSPVQDSKSRLVFEGKLAGERPFGCFTCHARCAEPGAECGCREIPAAGAKECVEQPLTSILKKQGKGWTGTLPQRVYSVEYAPLEKGQRPQDRAVVGYSYTFYLHRFDIRPKRK